MIEHTRFPLGDTERDKKMRAKILSKVPGSSLSVYTGDLSQTRAPQDGQCAAMVVSTSSWASVYQCTRTATVEEGGFGWCKQHVPSLVQEKKEARDARWKKERDEERRKWQRQLKERALDKAARKALREIANGQWDNLNSISDKARMIIDEHE